MNKIILFAIMLFATQFAFAQAPEKMSYQAILRNASGTLLQNKNVAVKVSVLQNSETGTVVYSERITGTTNSNGLLSMAIGSGTVISGTFSAINWSSGNYWLKTETDPNGGTNYTIAGTSQLLSVPYAMYAKNAGGTGTSQWAANGNNIYNSNAGNVGIGTDSPNFKLTVEDAGQGFAQIGGGASIGFYTDAGLAFLQTHSNTDLSFATNNGSASMTLQKGTGNFGIGNTNPSEKLEVIGKTKTTNLQVTNGAASGKVLTSDASGNATWQNSNISPDISTSGFLAGAYSFASSHPNANGYQLVEFSIYSAYSNQNTFSDGISFSESDRGFKAPANGFYHLEWNIHFNTAVAVSGNDMLLSVKKNGANYAINSTVVIAGNEVPDVRGSMNIKLQQGDVINFYLAQYTGVTLTIDENNNSTQLSGYRIY